MDGLIDITDSTDGFDFTSQPSSEDSAPTVDDINYLDSVEIQHQATWEEQQLDGMSQFGHALYDYDISQGMDAGAALIDAVSYNAQITNFGAWPAGYFMG